MIRRLPFILFAAIAACTGAGDDDTGTNPCPRTPAAADRERFAVVSHPYDAASQASNAWEVLRLDTSGVLSSSTVATFTMGRAFDGEIAFTPDGEVGIVAQENGTVGVFTIDAAGAVTVVHAGLGGAFYAGSVVMDPSGERVFVLDQQTIGNGGGAYALDIGCDGSLSNETLLFAGDLPYGLAHVAGDEWAAYARSLPDAPTGNDVHLLTLGDAVSIDGGLDAFPSDDDAIVYDFAVTSEGDWILAADANLFGTGNRIAVLSRDPLARGPELAVEDPYAISVSPHGDAFLVSSFSGDALWVGLYDATGVTSFTELTYTGGGPQLPGNSVTITRGSLLGLTLVAENIGVRRVRFAGAGTVTDLGRTGLGSGTDTIVGAIGVQP